MFYDIRQMFTEINNMTIIIINIFDMIENINKEAGDGDSHARNKVNMTDLRHYKYIIGFLLKLKDVK